MLGIYYTCVALCYSAHGCCAVECGVACCAAQHTAIATLTAVAIRAMILFVVMVMGRPLVRPMPWMPMSSRGICLASLKGINQSYLVIMFFGLTKLGQKPEFRNCSL